MNKFKARDDKTSDSRERSRDTERPNVLHEDVSSRQKEQRSAQPKQEEPKYKPKHGKKWPAVLLAGVAVIGGYQIGTHGGLKETIHDIGTYLVQKTTTQQAQPPYKNVAAKAPEAAAGMQVNRTPNRYTAAQVPAQSLQETALNMRDKLLTTRLHMVYRLDQEKMALEQRLLRDRNNLAQQEVAQQGVVNQSYAAENYSYAAENNSYANVNNSEAVANGAYTVVNTINAIRYRY